MKGIPLWPVGKGVGVCSKGVLKQPWRKNWGGGLKLRWVFNPCWEPRCQVLLVFFWGGVNLIIPKKGKLYLLCLLWGGYTLKKKNTHTHTHIPSKKPLAFEATRIWSISTCHWKLGTWKPISLKSSFVFTGERVGQRARLIWKNVTKRYHLQGNNKE